MDTFNTSGQCDIDTVIDQQRDIRRLSYSVKSLGNADLFSCIACLVTKLDNGNACKGMSG